MTLKGKAKNVAKRALRDYDSNKDSLYKDLSLLKLANLASDVVRSSKPIEDEDGIRI